MRRQCTNRFHCKYMHFWTRLLALQVMPRHSLHSAGKSRVSSCHRFAAFSSTNWSVWAFAHGLSRRRDSSVLRDSKDATCSMKKHHAAVSLQSKFLPLICVVLCERALDAMACCAHCGNVWGHFCKFMIGLEESNCVLRRGGWIRSL